MLMLFFNNLKRTENFILIVLAQFGSNVYQTINHFSFVKLTSWGSKIAERKLSRTMFGSFFQKICSRLVVLRVKIHFSPLKFCNTRFKGEGRESKKLMIKKLMKKLVQLIYLFSCIMPEIYPFEYQKRYSLS